jgi:hypothetical protein
MRRGSQRDGASRRDNNDSAAKETGTEDIGSRRNSIGAAISWLTDCVIEGFAAYANAIYPWQHEDDRWLGGDPMQSGQHEHRIGSTAPPSVDADLSGTVVAGRRSTGGSA